MYKDGPKATLTPSEKDAVRYALDDIGELYLYAGTPAGYQPDSESEVSELQRIGKKARMQAASLGIQR